MGIIRLTNVSKRFYLQHKRELIAQSLWKRMRRKGEAFWALDDVSFAIGAGEKVAVIGRNGAGKSTLLSIIAGVMSPTRGAVECNGRVSAMLELGTGFHPDLTGRENIYLNAALLGLRRKEVEEREPSILEFSEMQRFVDEPLRTYSTGMVARLGFAVAVHVEPEILVLDEVLSVGDASFREKCERKVAELVGGGTTLLLVSHSVVAVKANCERAIWLDGGRVEMDGPTLSVVEAYEEASASPSARIKQADETSAASRLPSDPGATPKGDARTAEPSRSTADSESPPERR